MNILLIRDKDTGKETQGTLFIDNKKFCVTLERPWLNNANNISCIPKGTYTCKWTFSPKFMRYTYEVMNVPNRTGVRIHKGNYFFDVQGCILLGSSFSDRNGDGELDVIESTVTIKKFEDLLNKQEFTLTIQ